MDCICKRIVFTYERRGVNHGLFKKSKFIDKTLMEIDE